MFFYVMYVCMDVRMYVCMYVRMLCYVRLCYVMLCYVMLCYVMLFYVVLCYVTLCYVMLRYVMLCYVVLMAYNALSCERAIMIIHDHSSPSEHQCCHISPASPLPVCRLLLTCDKVSERCRPCWRRSTVGHWIAVESPWCGAVVAALIRR